MALIKMIPKKSGVKCVIFTIYTQQLGLTDRKVNDLNELEGRNSGSIKIPCSSDCQILMLYKMLMVMIMTVIVVMIMLMVMMEMIVMVFVVVIMIMLMMMVMVMMKTLFDTILYCLHFLKHYKADH